MSLFTKEMLEQTLSKSDDSKESCSVYDLGPMEPVTGLIRPSEAWIVRCKYGSEVLVTRGQSALPMIDLDVSVRWHLPELENDPLLLFRYWLSDTELNLQLRVYETAHGYRLLVESQNLTPDGSVFAMLARGFECDPSYLKLCQKQDCYRARLTPKPKAAEGARVCKYLGTISGGRIDEYLSSLIQLHDERTGALLDSGELG